MTLRRLDSAAAANRRRAPAPSWFNNGAGVVPGAPRAQVNITTPLQGVVVFIDGQNRGLVRSDAGLEVPPGRPASIRLVLIGCKSWDTVVTVPDGKMLSLRDRQPTCPR